MTELLDRAIAQLKTLSADEQDAIAARIFAELDELERQREMFIYDQQGALLKAQEEAILAIARQLLDRLDDETISQTTGLSIEKIRNLRSDRI